MELPIWLLAGVLTVIACVAIHRADLRGLYRDPEDFRHADDQIHEGNVR